MPSAFAVRGLSPLKYRSVVTMKRYPGKRLGAATAIAAAAFCAAAPGVMAAGGGNGSSAQTTTGTEIYDVTITTKAKAALIGTNDLSSGDIHVKTRRGTVTLPLTKSEPDERQRMLRPRLSRSAAPPNTTLGYGCYKQKRSSVILMPN
ncbi:hypothetical protein [Burkholderia stagnalis]|uniref:hypothetical protein n=1 Tax=Burkholderia stagnalis TaxID=1503054 RepID=UPI000A725F59|nr:hypothetical protein [Burkholderia stagnalis]